MTPTETADVVEPRLRQLVDWSSAVWAGLIAGAVFFLANIFLTPEVYGGPWVMTRLFASLLLGSEVMTETRALGSGVLAAAVLVNSTLSILFACLIAFCLHRWGLVVGILGGAVFGLALYGVNFHALTTPGLFPWFYEWHNPMFIATHVLFGAMTGGIYEALEVEEFVEVEDDEEDEEPVAEGGAS